MLHQIGVFTRAGACVSLMCACAHNIIVPMLLLTISAVVWCGSWHASDWNSLYCLFQAGIQTNISTHRSHSSYFAFCPCVCMRLCIYSPFMSAFVCVFRCAPGFLGEYCHHKDPCHPGYCLNGGNCSVSMLAGVPVPSSATCTCPLGFTGQHCQTPQNSTCYPHNPCANKGICTLLPFDEYKCECTRGWTGGILSCHRDVVRVEIF